MPIWRLTRNPVGALWGRTSRPLGEAWRQSLIRFQNITGRDVPCATLSDFAATTAGSYRRLLHRFVDWMHDEGLVPFSGSIAVPRAKTVAPPRSARLPASARRTPASRSATGTTVHTPCVMRRRATCSNWMSPCMISRTCSDTAGLRQPRCIFPWTQNTCTSLSWRCPMQFHDDPTWMPPFGQPLCRSRHQVRSLQVRSATRSGRPHVTDSATWIASSERWGATGAPSSRPSKTRHVHLLLTAERLPGAQEPGGGGVLPAPSQPMYAEALLPDL